MKTPSAEEDTILLNCLNWQHEGLTMALSVVPDMTQYPHLRDCQQQITQQMQAAQQGIEELRNELQSHPLRPPDAQDNVTNGKAAY